MLRSIFIGFAAAVITFVISAIVLVIFDLYLSGHNLSSPMKGYFINYGPFQMSVADAIAMGLSIAVGVFVTVAVRQRRK